MVSLLSKFRGSLLGALIGDCLGAPFEGEAHICRSHLNTYFSQILDPSLKVPYKPYTDDTAMTKAAAESLIHNKGFNATDMAERITREYFANPKRGYGNAIVEIFYNWKKSKFQDVYGPAYTQFRGQGSYGNGAPMRVAPAALFSVHHNPHDVSGLISLVEDSSKITHTHKLGIRGAILQALAIRQALLLHDKNFDPMAFANQLIETMRELEKNDEPEPAIESIENSPVGRSYVKKLEIIKDFLSAGQAGHVPSHEDVQKQLGVHVHAIHSVPTAIYCFLAARARIPIDEIGAENEFQRCIQFAISLGGDTDTIASMAGALSGAHLGNEAIPKQFLRHCEAADEITRISDNLYEASQPEQDRANSATN